MKREFHPKTKNPTTIHKYARKKAPLSGELLCGLFAFPEFAQKGGAEDEGGAGEAGGGSCSTRAESSRAVMGSR